jgi:8-oxo-dGTP diphosphatase
MFSRKWIELIAYMDIPNNFYRTSIKALILDEEKRFLLVREDNGGWEIPGGGMDFGENYEQTIKREIKEEMGLVVINIAKHPSYFTNFINDNGYHVVNIIFVTKVENLNFTPSDECREIGFFDTESARKRQLLFSVPPFLEVFDPKRHY